MSHFLTVIDMKRCEQFDFGKSVSRAWAVWDEIKAAVALDSEELFMAAFPPESEGWGVPAGGHRMFEWMRGQPLEHFVLHNDATDHPAYMPPYDTQTRWWPLRGYIWHEEPRGLFECSGIGYLHVAPGDPLAKHIGTSHGSLGVHGLNNIIQKLRRTGSIERFTIPGLDLTVYK